MSKSRLGEKHPRANWWKITHSDGRIIILCGLSTWAKKNAYNIANIHSVYKGSRKKHKDIIKVEKIK
jgi:hypothetical protein